MARQNYFDILNRMEFDPQRELKNLVDLHGNGEKFQEYLL